MTPGERGPRWNCPFLRRKLAGSATVQHKEERKERPANFLFWRYVFASNANSRRREEQCESSQVWSKPGKDVESGELYVHRFEKRKPILTFNKIDFVRPKVKREVPMKN